MKVTSDFVFFWGKEDIFSQWNSASFVYEDILFKTAEHYMMFQKAVFFEYSDKSISDIKSIIAEERSLLANKYYETDNILVKILNASTPKKAKDLGKEVKFFNKQRWEAIVAKVLFKGNQLKFSQNKSLYDTFMSFKLQRFVEASPYDKIYGIGLKSSHPDASNPSRWRGQNILGDVLTQLRDYFIINPVHH